MKLVSSLSESVKLCGLGLSPGRRSICGGKTGRRTWFEQETAASKRSSASATMAEASMVWGGRYNPFWLFLRWSDQRAPCRLHWRNSPHHAGAAYMRRLRVVDLATSWRAFGGRPWDLSIRGAYSDREQASRTPVMWVDAFRSSRSVYRRAPIGLHFRPYNR